MNVKGIEEVIKMDNSETLTTWGTYNTVRSKPSEEKTHTQRRKLK